MRGENSPRSMTGFAEAQAELHGLTMWLSIRCINHRFMDLHIHLLEGWERQEALIRRMVRERIRRGRLDVRMNVTSAAASAIEMNHDIAGAYLKLVKNLRAEFQIKAEPDLVQLLRLPGVVSAAALFPGRDDGFDKLVEQCMGEALERLDQMRMAEGCALREDLRLHLQRIVELTENAATLANQANPLFARRLENRLKELLCGEGIDPTRLAQEAALAAERADTSEELSRLRSHARQFAAILEEAGEAGKRLDFLLQEMQREANTMLSKVSGTETENLEMTKAGLEMKSEIEKLKEQVQNLE
jgi:uncharacterized protein (TIGR00255 family)